jgi:lipoate-protein ligase A
VAHIGEPNSGLRPIYVCKRTGVGAVASIEEPDTELALRRTGFGAIAHIEEPDTQLALRRTGFGAVAHIEEPDTELALRKTGFGAVAHIGEPDLALWTISENRIRRCGLHVGAGICDPLSKNRIRRLKPTAADVTHSKESL